MPSAGREGSCAQYVPDMAGVASKGCSDAEMWSSKGREVLPNLSVIVIHLSLRSTYNWFDLLEDALVVEEANGIASDQTTERVAGDAELGDGVPFLPQLFEPSFNLVCDSLASYLSAIVSEAAGVALGDKDVEIRVSFANGSCEVLQVVRVAPKTVKWSAWLLP